MAERIYNDPEIGNVLFRKSSGSKRISIRIHPLKGVTVSIPYFLRYEDGMNFFLRKRDWIKETVSRQKEQLRKAGESGMAITETGNGTRIKTLLSEIVFFRDEGNTGKNIRVHTSPVEDVRTTGRMYLSIGKPITRKEVHYPGTAPAEGSPELAEVLKKALVKILRDEASRLLPQKLSFFAQRYGFSYRSVAIKLNATNWGSCSGAGNINLNLNLMRVPEPLCDYVLLHELCHLRHHDHGPEFHRLLERLCTDNLIRLAGLGDPEAIRLASLTRRSRAAEPVRRTLETQLKSWILLK